MTADEAKLLLAGCIRDELRDHAFGDAEVTWWRGGRTIATGSYGGSEPSRVDGDGWRLDGRDADALRNVGTLGEIERNDTTGPDEYCEGAAMPGLTLEGVFDELTKSQ